MHSPYVAGYWPSRKETKEQCARRAAIFFDRISADPEFAHWHVKGGSAKAALEIELPTTAKGILPFLTTNNRDTDHSPILELGFHLDGWNGSSASFSVTCGSFSPRIWNSIVMNLDEISEAHSSVLGKMRSLLEAMVYAWEPDDAVATSPQLIAQRGGGRPWLTKGWLNYSKAEGIIDNPL